MKSKTGRQNDPGNRPRAARFNVVRQRAEVVDPGDLGTAADDVQHGLAQSVDVEPAALDAGPAPHLSHGVIQVESVDQESN